MNQVKYQLFCLALIGTSTCSLAQESVVELYRVSSPGETTVSGISTEGLMSWSNEVAGTMVRVEVADPSTTNEWNAFTHVIPAGHMGSVQLWDARTPEGFAFCPAGTFIMGSPTDELGRSSHETQHQVTLTRDFFVQKTEVTYRQMADVLNWAHSQGKVSVSSLTVLNLEGSEQELLDLDGDGQISWNGARLVVDADKDDYPCTEVTWYGAQAYCNYLSDIERLTRAVDFSDWTWSLAASGYRLPTEAEWEYACRAGTTTAFYTGEITTTGIQCSFEPNLDVVGWYCGNAGNTSHPVALKQPNAWDLFDMHGNVWEWCGDRYGTYPGTVTDPSGPSSGDTRRIFRGGSWNYLAWGCRSASRHVDSPGYSDSRLGFRPARSAVP